MITIDCKYGMRMIVGLKVSSLAEAKKKRAELKESIRDCDRWYFAAKDEAGKKVLGSYD